ncbi:MAG TPA: ABC transporter permease [bacterium]|nr:ABC transporter permease [bacterium]
MREAAEIAVGGLLAGSVFALVAVGFTLVYNVMGVPNLAQGAFVVLGALTMYSLETRLHWPLLIAALGSSAAVMGVGAAMERFVVRPARARLHTGEMLILLVGLLTFFEGAALLIWGSQPYSIPAFSGERPVVVGGIGVPTQAFWIVGITGAIVAVLWFILARTPFGKALRASAENPLAAGLMGVHVPRMTLFAFAAGAAIGAIGGEVLGPVTSIEFDTGRFFTNLGFVAFALGGMGSFFGAIAGGLGLGLAQQLTAGYVSSLFSNTLTLVLLLAVLIWRPGGLLGAGSPRREDVREAVPLPGGARSRLGGAPARALTAGGALIVAALPLLLGATGLVGSLVITGILFIAVMGLDLLMGYAGQVSLGQAGFMAVGGYTAAILATRYAVPPLLATGAGIVLTLAVALVLAIVTARLRGLYLALATLAFGLLVDSVAVGATNLTGGPSGIVGVPSFAAAGYTFASPLATYYLVWGMAAGLLVLLANLARSGYGRALLAIRADPTAARALGIRVPRYKVSVFLLSAGLASLAGSLYAFHFHFLSPEMVGTSRSIEMIAMLALGGERTLVGPLIGVALLTLLPTAFQPLALYKTLAEGLILILIMLYLPGGIFGGAAAALGRLGRGAVPRGPAVEGGRAS